MPLAELLLGPSAAPCLPTLVPRLIPVALLIVFQMEHGAAQLLVVQLLEAFL